MQIAQLTSCNLYANGKSFAGALVSCTLPEVKHKGIEHKAGDGIGTPKLPGALEAMTSTMKLNGLYADFHGLTVDPNNMLSIQIRANQKVRNAAGNLKDVPVIIHMRGWASSRKIGELKSSEGSNPEYVIEVWYYKLVVDGEEIEEIDVENCVHRQNGVDLMANYRSNLGI